MSLGVLPLGENDGEKKLNRFAPKRRAAWGEVAVYVVGTRYQAFQRRRPRKVGGAGEMKQSCLVGRVLMQPDVRYLN